MRYHAPLKHLSGQSMDTLLSLLASLLDGDLPAAELAFEAHLRSLAAAGIQTAGLRSGWESMLSLKDSQNPISELEFIGNFRYGRHAAKVYKANNVAGLVLPLMTNDLVIRLRDPHGDDNATDHMGFSDYNWVHDDASIIVKDELAAFYVLDNGRKIFDHSPEVLGLTPC
jgi:hypothetical protein